MVEGSIAVFGWDDGRLILLLNRENWVSDSRTIKPITWNGNGQILGAWTEDEVNVVGKWCGCSKTGRVSFIVETDSMLARYENKIESLSVDFLKSKLSPKAFAKKVKKNSPCDMDDEDSPGYGLVYHAIVADITTKSMFYIGKSCTESSLVETIEIGYGPHTLSAYNGLDSDETRDLRLKQRFSEMVSSFGNQEIPPINEIPMKFMYAPDVFNKIEKHEYHGEVDSDDENNETVYLPYGTASTTALVLKENRHGILYERYSENGRWKENTFNF